MPVSPRTVCFVADPWSVKQVLALPKGRFDGVVLVPLKFDLFLILRHHGFECIDVFAHLDDDEIRQFFVDTRDLTEGWFADLAEDSEYGGYVIPYIDRLSIYVFFHDARFAIHVIRDVLDNNPQFDRILLFPNLKRPQELFRPATDVVTAIAHYIATERKLPCETIKIVETDTPPLLPLLPRLAGEKVPERPAARRYAHLVNPKALRPEDKPTVLIVIAGMTGSLPAQLGAQLSDRYSLVFATTWMTWDEMQALAEYGEVLPVGLPYRPAGEAHAGRFVKAREKMRLPGATVRKDYPEIFDNPGLEHQFDNLAFRRWPEICEYLDTLRSKLDRLDIDAAMICISMAAEGYLFFQELGRKCPRVLVPHSFSLVSNWQTLLLDPVFQTTEVVAASFACEKFMAPDVHPSRYVTTGTLLFPDFGLPDRTGSWAAKGKALLGRFGLKQQDAGYSEEALEQFIAGCAARGRTLLERYRISGDVLALVVTGNYTTNIAPFGNGRRNFEAYRALFDLPPEIAGKLRFVVKAKSEEWDSGEEYFQRIVDACGATDRVTVVPTHESLFDLAAACDFSVGVNSNTSGYFYPLLLGRPLLHIQTMGIYVGYGEKLTSFQLPDTLHQTVTDVPAMREALVRLTLDEAYRVAEGLRQRAVMLAEMPLDPTRRYERALERAIEHGLG